MEVLVDEVLPLEFLIKRPSGPIKGELSWYSKIINDTGQTLKVTYKWAISVYDQDGYVEAMATLIDELRPDYSKKHAPLFRRAQASLGLQRALNIRVPVDKVILQDKSVPIYYWLVHLLKEYSK